jgi:hypothetical protein
MIYKTQSAHFFLNIILIYNFKVLLVFYLFRNKRKVKCIDNIYCNIIYRLKKLLENMSADIHGNIDVFDILLTKY